MIMLRTRRAALEIRVVYDRAAAADVSCVAYPSKARARVFISVGRDFHFIVSANCEITRSYYRDTCHLGQQHPACLAAACGRSNG